MLLLGRRKSEWLWQFLKLGRRILNSIGVIMTVNIPFGRRIKNLGRRIEDFFLFRRPKIRPLKQILPGQQIKIYIHTYKSATSKGFTYTSLNPLGNIVSNGFWNLNSSLPCKKFSSSLKVTLGLIFENPRVQDPLLRALDTHIDIVFSQEILHVESPL